MVRAGTTQQGKPFSFSPCSHNAVIIGSVGTSFTKHLVGWGTLFGAGVRQVPDTGGKRGDRHSFISQNRGTWRELSHGDACWGLGKERDQLCWGEGRGGQERPRRAGKRSKVCSAVVVNGRPRVSTAKVGSQPAAGEQRFLISWWFGGTWAHVQCTAASTSLPARGLTRRSRSLLPLAGGAGSSDV